MMEYKRFDDRVFGILSRNSYFIVNTFPFKVYQIDNIGSFEELDLFYQDEMKGSDLIPYSNDYRFKGFFAMEWIMTSECNLNCPHCFAHVKGENGRYGLGEKHPLSIEELKAGIDHALVAFEEDITENNLSNAEFQLFIIGGEPLIEANNIMIAVDYLHEKLDQIKLNKSMDSILENYFVATNGLLIDDRIAKFFTKYPFTVSVSIDTPINPIKLDNTMTRKTEIAINGAKKLIEHGCNRVIINCVIPADKVYHLDGIMNYVENLGIMDKISGVQISPLTPPTRQSAFSGCKAEEVVISDWSKDLERCRYFSKKLIEYCKKYNTDMKKYHSRIRSMLNMGGMGYRCPVGQWKWCLCPGGDIYPCHQFVGIEKYKMGNVFDPEEVFKNKNAVMQKFFEERNVFKVKPCDNCPLQSCCVVFIDCPGRALLEGGSMYEVPEHQCLMAKNYLLEIFEKALWGEL